MNKFNLHVTIETIFGVHVSGSRVFFSRLLSNENMDSKKTSEIRVSVYLRDRRAYKQALTPNVRGDKMERVKFRLFCKQKRDKAGDGSDQNDQSYHETLGVVLSLRFVAERDIPEANTKQSKAK